MKCKRFFVIFCLAVLSLGILAFAACGSDGDAVPVDVSVSAVVLDQTAVTMSVGDQLTLKANIEPAEAADKQVQWVSSSPAVAAVSAGTVTALSAGTAVIAASAGGAVAFCTVTVEAGTLVADVSALRTALREADTGDIIRLQAGEYSLDAPLSIDVPLTLQGEAGALLVGPAGDAGKGAVLSIRADGVTVRNLTIRGAENGAKDGISLANCLQARLEGVTVENCLAGIRIENASAALAGVTTRSNEEGGVCLTAEGEAIYLSADERCSFGEVLPISAPSGAQNIAIDLPAAYHAAELNAFGEARLVWTTEQGITDGAVLVGDYASLSLAAAQALPGQAICVAGEFALEACISLTDGVTVYGTRGNRLSVSGGLTAFSMRGASLIGVCIAKTDNEDASLVRVLGDAVIEGCTFTGVYDGLADEGRTRAIEQSAGTSVSIKNSMFENLRQAAYLQGDGSVVGNEVRGTRGFVALLNTSITFAENLFEGNGADIIISSYTGVTGNLYEGQTVALSAANGGCYVINQPANEYCDDGKTLVKN